MIDTKPTILLAMSGGMDSSMAAILLLEQGYNVEGVTLITYSETAQFIDEAAKLAKQLNIVHHIVDVRTEFNEVVMNYFLSEYQLGRTPNPCVVCNEHIKWAALVGKADELAISTVATGHYANISTINSTYHITKGKDASKDQSYFLWRLPQHILRRVYFPLGHLTKNEVREMANERGFAQVANKKESMGICFLNGTNIATFLSSQLSPAQNPKGDITNQAGEIVGQHDGIANYTIGQKKGLNINAEGNQCVVKINADKNQLVVGHPDLLWVNNLTINDFYFANKSLPTENREYKVRIRGIDRVPYHLAKVQLTDDRLAIQFHQPIWAPTPGQSVVIYQNEMVLGGGVLD